MSSRTTRSGICAPTARRSGRRSWPSARGRSSHTAGASFSSHPSNGCLSAERRRR
jgi:hypothetical protein